ncbi:MAG: peptide chain release factor N(5)-glutamine methyltransferase [Lachnospiraceae bacterium]|nr:peptide chain release factor N(5)-glutamine methyltransferase [Lachnospiraceae bacterium]
MSYKELLKEITEKLKATNVPEAESAAWRLFEGITGFDRAALFMKGNEEVTDASMIEKARKWTEERLTGCPVQYIIGYQEFCGLTFEVGRDTLIPRFDTELLAEKVMELASGKKVLDMCTGTGCILISVARMADTKTAVGCDISEGAVRLAQRNAVRNGVSEKTEFFTGDLFDALKNTKYENEKFDIIVSNPPYIRSEVIETLSPTVRDFEPRAALDGTEDGLWFYERITTGATYSLASDGILAYEIGYDQGADVKRIMSDKGFKDISIIKDYAGLDRIVIGRKDN